MIVFSARPAPQFPLTGGALGPGLAGQIPGGSEGGTILECDLVTQDGE